jgi:hypothetical protein
LVGYNTEGAIVSSYWDNQASGLSIVGVGNGSASGVTGLTTAQLQSGAMPVGFNATNSVWLAPAHVYPYFGFQGPLVTISGTAYSGSSTISSAGVGVLSGGLLLADLTTNSNGFYTLSEPSNMLNSTSVLTYLTSNGTANTFSDGAGPNGYTGMDLHTGTVSLLNASSTTLSALNAAVANALGSNSGDNFLFTVPSGQLSLNTGTNLSIASSAAAFTVDQPLTTTGNILINSTGSLSIAASSALTAGASDNITLVTGGAFANHAGANALNVSDGGKWLVYSQNPINDTTGGLTPAFKQYDATYGVTAPASSGDGLLYTLAPVVTETIVGAASKTYDGTTAATLSSSDFTPNGVVQGDTLTFTTPTAGVYASPNAGTGIGVTASGIAIATAFSGSTPVYGYQLGSSSATGDVGTITPAVLTYTSNPGSRTYGAANPIFTGSVTGFVDGQTLSSATTGSATFTSPATAVDNVGIYAIEGSGLTANNGNYTFIQAATNSSAFTISPATLTYTASPGAGRTYGAANPIFTGSVLGFVNGQTLASATSGSLLFSTPATPSSPVGSYPVIGSGLTADNGNYVFTQAGGNATAFTITAAIVPPPPPPTPTPKPTTTVLTFAVNSSAELAGQIPTLSATYTGPVIKGLNIASLLAGLTYQLTPAFNGLGTYKITATGSAPSGYALQILPGTLTIVSNSPDVLPTQVFVSSPLLPYLLTKSGPALFSTLLEPRNSLGFFQIGVTGLSNGLGASFGFNDQQTPLAQSSFFTISDGKTDIYNAGAKP